MSPLPRSEMELAAHIDQTNLRPQATRSEMEAFLDEVREHGFATAAILPLWAPLAAEKLAGCGVAVDPAVGFPLGSASTRQKAEETAWCIAHSGPQAEIDLRLVFGKHISLIGSTMGNHEDFRTVMRLILEGRLRPIVDCVLPLAEARAAHERLEQGLQFGKVVLAP